MCWDSNWVLLHEQVFLLLNHLSGPSLMAFVENRLEQIGNESKVIFISVAFLILFDWPSLWIQCL